MKTEPNSKLKFRSGHEMKNRFALAPMTNTQSHKDGTLSDDEYKWLVKRAEGGFGMVMTCASHVQEVGKGFPGQLGIFGDEHIEGLTSLAKGIKSYGSLALVQLHHAGMRSPSELIGEAPHCPSRNEKFGARELKHQEVTKLRDDFIAAAFRAKKAGYDGVEVHGAHGYILAQFLSSEINHRSDEYGGSLENRSRLILEILEGIRKSCGYDFMLGLRLSPERFGMDLQETKSLTSHLCQGNLLDFIDISLWDYTKEPEDEEYKHKKLLEHFTELDLGNTPLTVAGKISNAIDVQEVLHAGVDFVSIGRSAILHHDFPTQVLTNSKFEPTQVPVSEEYLKSQSLGPDFITYMKRWPGFVEEN